MKYPKCFLVEYHKICPICDDKIPLAGKHSLRRCYNCGATTYKNEKTSK